ncbi:MAG: acylphosphatase [Lactobacillus sp.]
METVKLTIHGRVQGVGFRWSVQTLATALKLNGDVANNADGSVTIHLQGIPEQINTFKAKLPHRLSPFSKITEITQEISPNSPKMADFHVLY